MPREYRSLAFSSDEAFIAHHEALAAAGDENSKSVLNTRCRLKQAELIRNTQAAGSGGKEVEAPPLRIIPTTAPEDTSEVME